MIKKIILGLLALIVIAMASIFAINGKDNYDPSKYFAKASKGIEVGSKLDFTLPDQFDKSHSLSDNTKKLILVFAKSTGHDVKAFLNGEDKDFLKKKDALFIADISPMPTVIRNTFALPDLRKSKYSVLLIYDENIAKKLKNEKEADKIAIISLKDKVITGVKYISTTKELKDNLK